MKLLSLFRRRHESTVRERTVIDHVNRRIELERARIKAQHDLIQERSNLRQTAEIIGSQSRRVVALSNAMSLVRDGK